MRKAPPRNRVRYFTIDLDFQLKEWISMLYNSGLMGNSIEFTTESLVLNWVRDELKQKKYPLNDREAVELGYILEVPGRRTQNIYADITGRLRIGFGGVPRYYIEYLGMTENVSGGRGFYQKNHEEVLLEILRDIAPRKIQEARIKGWLD